MTDVRLASVVVAGGIAPWEALGFTAVGSVIPLSNGAIECDPAASGMSTLRVTGVADRFEIDDVAVSAGDVASDSVRHPNGCHELDHVVIMTPSLERTSAAIEAGLGLPLKRIREARSVRQGFHRFPDRGCIIEVVESDRVGIAALWGLVVIADDLDLCCATIGGDLMSGPRPAVQPGRRIATIRSAAGLPCPVAVMSR